MSILFNKSGSAVLDLSTFDIPLSTISPSRPTAPCVVGGVFNYLKKLIATKKPLTLITTESSIVTPYESSNLYTLTYIKDDYIILVYVNSSNEVWSYKKEVSGGGGSTDVYHFVDTVYDVEPVVTSHEWGDSISYECEIDETDFDATKINVLRCRIQNGAYWSTMNFILSPINSDFTSLRGSLLSIFMTNVLGLINGAYDVTAFVNFTSDKLLLTFYSRVQSVSSEINWSLEEVNWDTDGWVKKLTDDENKLLEFQETTRVIANIQLNDGVYNYGVVTVLFNRAVGNGLCIVTIYNSLDENNPIITSGEYLLSCNRLMVYNETSQEYEPYLKIVPYNITSV